MSDEFTIEDLDTSDSEFAKWWMSYCEENDIDLESSVEEFWTAEAAWMAGKAAQEPTQ